MKIVFAFGYLRNPKCLCGRRSILDGALIANECTDSMLKKGLSGIMCKLDLEKSYDRVNLEFFEYMMRRMGFGIRWRN